MVAAVFFRGEVVNIITFVMILGEGGGEPVAGGMDPEPWLAGCGAQPGGEECETDAYTLAQGHDGELKVFEDGDGGLGGDCAAGCAGGIDTYNLGQGPGWERLGAAIGCVTIEDGACMVFDYLI